MDIYEDHRLSIFLPFSHLLDIFEDHTENDSTGRAGRSD